MTAFDGPDVRARQSAGNPPGLDSGAPSLHFTVMKPVALILVMILAVSALSETLSREERFVRFVAGCELLSDAAAARPAVKSAAMRWLIGNTGFTPETALQYIERYRNRPVAWQKALESMRLLLEQPREQQSAAPLNP